MNPAARPIFKSIVILVLLSAAFFTATVIKTQWQPRRSWTLALVAIPMVLITDTVALVALALFRRGAAPLDALVVVTPLTALLTAVFALPLIWILGKLDRFVERRKHEAVGL